MFFVLIASWLFLRVGGNNITVTLGFRFLWAVYRCVDIFTSFCAVFVSGRHSFVIWKCVFVCSCIGRVGSWLTYVDTFITFITRASTAFFAFVLKTFLFLYLETRFCVRRNHRCEAKWYWLWTVETFAKLFFLLPARRSFRWICFLLSGYSGIGLHSANGEFYNGSWTLFLSILTYETVWAFCVVRFIHAAFGSLR